MCTTNPVEAQGTYPPARRFSAFEVTDDHRVHHFRLLAGNDLGSGTKPHPKRANYFPKIPTLSRPLPETAGILAAQRFEPSGPDADAPRSRDDVVLGKGTRPPFEAPTQPSRPQPTRRKSKGKDKRKRKTSLALTREQYIELNEGWHHARRIGRPLNYMLTIRPADIDALEPAERQALWQRTYKKLEQYARTKSIEWTAIWSRESQRPTGRGEHWHILLHLPNGLAEHFESTVRKWFTGRHEVDLSPRDQRTRFVKGKAENAATYVTKAAPPTITYRSTVPYRPSGPIFGRRAGITRNIGSKAVGAWNARMERLAA